MAQLAPVASATSYTSLLQAGLSLDQATDVVAGAVTQQAHMYPLP